MANQDWFPYNYEENKMVRSAAKLPLVRCSTSGAEVLGGRRPEIRPKIGNQFAQHGIFMDYIRLVWR